MSAPDSQTIALLNDVAEYLAGKADVLDGQDGPRPNAAMILGAAVDAEIERLERSNGPSERDAALEEAAKICERWPLDPLKMEDSLRWGKHGVANAVAGTCNALGAAIRALKNAAPQACHPEAEEHVGQGRESPAGAAPSEAGADDARDAARYRWWTQNFGAEYDGPESMKLYTLINSRFRRGLSEKIGFDAAIDGAMAASKSNATSCSSK